MIEVIAIIKNKKNECFGYLLKSGSETKIISKESLFSNNKLLASLNKNNIKIYYGDRCFISGKNSKLKSISYDEALKIDSKIIKLKSSDIGFDVLMFKDNTNIILDVSELYRHGLTSFSSGALPKWDLKGFMIKGSGDYVANSLNECFISETLYKTGIDVAKYGLVKITYNENNIRNTEIACITKLFTGSKVDSRRILDKDKSFNDSVIKLCDALNMIERQKLIDMFVLDYIFMQTDRHRKNIEFLTSNNQMTLAPLYDFGSSLLQSYDDSVLYHIGVDFKDMAKIESRTNLENIQFINNYISDKISFRVDELYRNSRNVLAKYSKLYGKTRTEFIERIILGRCKIVRNLFSAK